MCLVVCTERGRIYACAYVAVWMCESSSLQMTTNRGATTNAAASVDTQVAHAGPRFWCDNARAIHRPYSPEKLADRRYQRIATKADRAANHLGLGP